jgi:hypothetical protein
MNDERPERSLVKNVVEEHSGAEALLVCAAKLFIMLHIIASNSPPVHGHTQIVVFCLHPFSGQLYNLTTWNGF